MRGAEDVGALRHEVDAAEDDVVRPRIARRPLRQLEGVAALVGEADDVVALVVVAEDDEPLAELRLRGRDALDELRRVERAILEGDVLLPAREGKLLGRGARSRRRRRARGGSVVGEALL